MGVDQTENRGIIDSGLRKSNDETIRLFLADEKLLKRFRQLNDGIVTVVIYGGRPILLSCGGRLEVLDKFQA